MGNSIVVETKEKNYRDFKKLQLLYMGLTTWITVCLVGCTQPFMKVWLGEKMMFEDGVMIVFCVYFFSTHFVRVCHLYRQAAGLWWQDRYRPIVETVSNLVLNILFVKVFGVYGVMFSTIFCMVCIEGTWGTRILFKHYFTEEKQSKYMFKLLWSWLLAAIASAIVYFVCGKINLEGIPAIIVFGIIGSVVSVGVFCAGNCFLPEFKDAFEFGLRLIGAQKIMAKIGKSSKED